MSMVLHEVIIVLQLYGFINSRIIIALNQTKPCSDSTLATSSIDTVLFV